MPLSVVGSVNATSTPPAETDDWNLSVEPQRFWIYEAKIRNCPVTPHFQERSRCGTCGVTIAEKGSGFCGDDCARTFVVNHNWDLARFAAMHRDHHTCTRCGYRTSADDPTQDLVVRHLEIPPSGNVRGRGCHQHLTNLETLCRSCDSAVTATPAPDASAPVSEPAPAPIVDYLAPPTTTVKPEDLEAGLCHPSSGIDPEFWFNPINRRAAQKICADCPVKIKCAQYALDMRVTNGMFAGVALPGRRHARTLRERRKMLQELIDTASGAVSTNTPAEDVPATEMERAGA